MGWTDSEGRYHEDADEQSNRVKSANDRAAAATSKSINPGFANILANKESKAAEESKSKKDETPDEEEKRRKADRDRLLKSLAARQFGN